MNHEGGSQALVTASNRSDEDSGSDCSSSDEEGGGNGINGDDGGSDSISGDDNHNSGGNNDDDDSSRDLPTKGWEEFDEDAAYQKKHVDPEMRRWVLTNDCRRIISNEFFNNPVDEQGTCNPSLKKGSDYVACSGPIGLVLRQLYTKK